MSLKPIDILGGESVYCINRAQLEEAKRLAEADPESAPKLQELLSQTEQTLSRNERAALAFMLIERLRSSSN